MTTIRTPDDENPDWLYAPFTEGWYYVGATYAGHSPYASDWNRRTKNGGWLNDLGDPVLAPQDGTVAEVDKAEGLVMLHHHGGRTQVELRHMQNIRVKPGDKVARGDRIGSIGDVAGSGRSTAPHLHMVQYGRKTTAEPFRRVPLTIEGKRIATSVSDSDTRPAGWKAPDPVMLQGPPPKATWESAFRESEKARLKVDAALAAQKAQTSLATDERDQARRELDAMRSQWQEAETALLKAALDLKNTQSDLAIAAAKIVEQDARIAELEAQGPDTEPPVDTVPMEFSYADYPVVDGFATLPDGTRIASTSDVVRVPVLSTAA